MPDEQVLRQYVRPSGRTACRAAALSGPSRRPPFPFQPGATIFSQLKKSFTQKIFTLEKMKGKEKSKMKIGLTLR
jgi:hypothetical protein